MTIEANTSEDSIDDLFAFSSPIPLTIILVSYLVIILKIGPSFMKSRPAYQLKTFIVIYNILQVVACIYLIYKICTADVPSIRFWKCVHFVRGTKEEMQFNHISIFTFWLKVVELSETVVFVLRKKQRQVSFLHVFHHCSTLFMVYQLFKAYKGSAALFPLMLNSFVHIVMYIYYLMAAVCPPNIVAKLTPFKKAITTLQMVQFILILVQVVTAFIQGCVLPPVIVVIYVAVICSFFYMFYDFYQKNYSTKKKSPAEAKKET